jgi:hypothetical protein
MVQVSFQIIERMTNKKNQKNHRVENVSIEVYKTVVNIIIAKDFKKALEDLGMYEEFAEPFDSHDKTDEFIKGASAMFFHLSKAGRLVIITPSDVTPGQIAHECFHALCCMMKEKGISLTDSSEEAWAYTLDYLVENTQRLIFGKKK